MNLCVEIIMPQEKKSYFEKKKWWSTYMGCGSLYLIGASLQGTDLLNAGEWAIQPARPEDGDPSKRPQLSFVSVSREVIHHMYG